MVFVNPKPWWKSKTVWVAILELTIVVGDKIFDVGALGQSGQIALTISALAKVFLRLLTTGPVKT